MLDAPETVTIEGQEYKVQGFTQEIQSAFERYMHRHLLKELQDSKELLGVDYLPMLEQHVRKQKRGHLNFGSESFLEFIGENEHFVQLMWFVLADLQRTLPVAVVKKWITEHWDDAADLFNRLYSTKKN